MKPREHPEQRGRTDPEQKREKSQRDGRTESQGRGGHSWAGRGHRTLGKTVPPKTDGRMRDTLPRQRGQDTRIYSSVKSAKLSNSKK